MPTSLNKSCLQLTFLMQLVKFFLTLLLILNLPSPALSAPATEESLKAQLVKQPTNLKLRQQLAIVHFQNERYEQAIETLRANSERLSPENLMLLSECYAKLDDSTNEHKFLEQLTINYPQFLKGRVALGEYFLRMAQQKKQPKFAQEAEASFRLAIELNPNHRPAYEGLLKAYESLGNAYETRILLGDILKRFGKSPEVLSGLCRRNALDGFFPEAKRFCKDAISIAPKRPDNFVYLSLVENNEGNLKKANAILKKVATSFPDSEFASSSYADFLIQQKNILGAETYFTQASRANSQSFRAQIGLALTSFELKHYGAALEAFEKACTLLPHHTYKHLKRSTDLLRHRNEQKMQGTYQSAMNKCTTTSEESRLPAGTDKEGFVSPFAPPGRY